MILTSIFESLKPPYFDEIPIFDEKPSIFDEKPSILVKNPYFGEKP